MFSTRGPQPDHIGIQIDRADPWDEFNEARIDQTFRGFFQHQIPTADHLVGALSALTNETDMEREEDLNGFFIEAVHPVLNHVLEYSRVFLEEGTKKSTCPYTSIPR